MTTTILPTPEAQGSLSLTSNHSMASRFTSFAAPRFADTLRRLCVAAIAVLGSRVGLRVLRALNPRLKLVDTLFVMYPATTEYAQRMTFASWVQRFRARLTPCMVFRQGGRWGLVLATGYTERELARDPELLARVLESARSLQRGLAVPRLTFSGILPSLFVRAGLAPEHTEADATAQVVVDGILQVREQHGLRADTPIAVLGGAGQIGRRVVARLMADGCTAIAIDPVSGATQLPDEWHGQPVLLINVASRAALRQQLPKLWSKVVYVNEAYPEPRAADVAALKRAGDAAWHIAGVQGRAFPSFPGAYREAIPCCAATLEADSRAVVKRLS